MDEPSEEGLKSTPVTNGTSFPVRSNSRTGGFYSTFIAERNLSTPCKPSFLDHTKSEVLLSTTKKDPGTLKSNISQSISFHSMLKSTSTPITPVSSFGNLKRKRPADVVEKPTFKVSELVDKEPRLPAFGTSLSKAKFDFTQNRSMFYSGRTKFGGGSAIREAPSKRIKISPVSKNIRSNVTQVSNTRPFTSEHRTLTSKTAENILKTLNKIAEPCSSRDDKSLRVDPSSSYSTLSKRIREKRKIEISLPRLPLERLNQIKPVEISNIIKDDAKPIVAEAREVPTSSEVVSNSETIVVSDGVTNSEKVEVFETIPDQANDVIEEEETCTNKEEITCDLDSNTNVVASSESSVNDEELKSEPTLQTEDNEIEITEVLTEVPKPLDVISIPDSGSVVGKNGLKMKRQRATSHYSATEKMEEPVNTMPEVKEVEPLIISSLPTFDIKVQPTSTTVSLPVTVSTPLPEISKTPGNVESGPMEEESKPPSNLDSTVCSDPKQEQEPLTVAPSEPLPISLPEPAKVSLLPPAQIFTPILKSKVCVDPSNDFMFSSPKIVSDKDVNVNSNTSFTFISPVPVKNYNTDPDSTFKGILNPQAKLFGLSPVKEMSSVASDIEKETPAPSLFRSVFEKVTKTEACPDSGPISAIPEFSFAKPSSTISSETTNVSLTNGFTFSQPTSAGLATSAHKITDKEEPTISPLLTEDKTSMNKETLTVSKEPSTDGNIKPNPFALLNAASKDTWECPTCMVSNKMDVLKCVACTECKPGSDSTKLSEKNDALSFGTGKSATGGFSFGNIQNEPTKIESKSESLMKSSVFAKLKPPEGSWSCPTCMVDNDEKSLKCVACTESKPGVSADEPISNTATTTTEFKFGTNGPSKPSEFSFKAAAAASYVFMKFSQPEGSWECPTCMVSNKGDCLQCVACSEAKPGSKGEASVVPVSSKPSEFSFGATDSTKSAFSFGAKESTSAFSFGTLSSGKSSFSFGTNDSKPAFSFGGMGNVSSVHVASKSEEVKPEETRSETTALTKNSEDFTLISKSVPSISSNFSLVPSVSSLQSIPSTGNSEVSLFGKGSSVSGFSFGSNTNTNPNDKPFSFVGSESSSLPNMLTKPVSGAVSEANGPTSFKESASSMFTFKGASSGSFVFGSNSKENEKVSAPASNNIFGSLPTSDSSNINGAPSLPPPQFNFNSSTTNGPSFLLNSNETKLSETSTFSFNSVAPAAGTGFNFGVSNNAAPVFGSSSTGQFSFTNNINNNNPESSKGMFTGAPTGGNLFTIGGGGGGSGPNLLTNNNGPTGRKVKRAHRKLPMRK